MKALVSYRLVLHLSTAMPCTTILLRLYKPVPELRRIPKIQVSLSGSSEISAVRLSF